MAGPDRLPVARRGSDAGGAVAAFDADRCYRLGDQVALRPEPFGALAYHYGTRRLNLLKSPDLLRLLEVIHRHASARAAFDACGIDSGRWPSFARALAALVASDFLVAA